MFKSARWRSDKTKIKAEFKLHFHATQVPELVDALAISVVPGDVGKPALRLEKATPRAGNCRWDNPAYVTVKFDTDHKTGKLIDRIYYFRVSTGLGRTAFLGEVSIDFAKYAEASKPSSVSLPLQSSYSEAVLHIGIQRLQEDADKRDVEEFESLKAKSPDVTLNNYLRTGNTNNTTSQDRLSDETEKLAGFNANHRASSGSDITLSSSESSSGLDDSQEPNGFLSPLCRTPVARKSSAREADCTLESLWSLQSDHVLKKDADDETEILKAELSVLARQADMSEMELQTLRKQIVKESKKGQDLMSEILSLKTERDELKVECEKLKGFQNCMDDANVRNKLKFVGGDMLAILEEMRQELNYEKDLNVNLRLQLQKTQESNNELIFAVQDLEELLDQRNCEISDLYTESKSRANAKEMKLTSSECQTEEDREQKELDDLVKGQNDDNGAYMLERKVIDLYNEIEIHLREKEELGMQIEQLSLDYEILKQENHDLSHKLEQSRLQERLKIQYECSSSAATIYELETKIESLEAELKQQSAEHSNTLTAIRELDSHVKSLEEELEKQGQEFEADLEAMTLHKVEQEQRAIQAEEALRKLRLKNANTAEKLQEEFGRLSKQMASTFEANEKVAMKALAEASELRSQRSHLEAALQRANEELRSVRESYEEKLQEVSHQIKGSSSQFEQMASELETKSKQLECQKKNEDAKCESLFQEMQMLKSEIDRLTRENNNLNEQAGQEETMRYELEQMKILVGETEMLIETRNVERNELVNTVALVKKESEKLMDELWRLRKMKDEKESFEGLLQSELEKLRVQCNDLKRSAAEDEIEKEKLRKQVVQLKGDLKKMEALNNSEKKLRHTNGRAATTGGNKTAPKTKINSAPHGSIEVANLREKIKSLERLIKLKESALETSQNSLLQKEQEFCNRIQELESRLEEPSHFDTFQKVINGSSEAGSYGGIFGEARNGTDNLSSNVSLAEGNVHALAIMSSIGNASETATELPKVGDDGNHDKLLTELSTLKQKNRSMESELKDMEERYSEISLKFAEVEGERQQLVMTLRNLKNAKRSESFLTH